MDRLWGQAPPDVHIQLRETHHRIKNHLQLVASLLSIQARDAGDPRVSAPLRDAHRRVLAIARLQEHFQDLDQSERVEIACFLTGLCHDLGASLGGGVRFKPQIEPAWLETDRAVALALAMSELATNAAKHAYAGGKGDVRIVLAHWTGGWRLTVSDDGPGLPSTNDGLATGIGLQILQLLVRKLKGSLNVDQVERGASISLHFA